MGEKMEATKWGVLIFSGIVAALLIVTFIGYALRPIDKMVERKVLVESHQYQEAKSEQIAILEASLAEIDVQLLSTTDPIQRANLKAQQATLNVQLNAAMRR